MKEMNRPRHIWYFLFAFLGGIAVSLLDFAAQLAGISRQDLEVLTFGNFITGTLITLVFIWFIFRRKNWARIVYTVLTVLSLPFAGVAIARELDGDWIGAISSGTQVVLALASIVFLFTRPSREWFSASQQSPGGDDLKATPQK